MASRENDLSFTSESPVVVRRRLSLSGWRYARYRIASSTLLSCRGTVIQRCERGPLPELEVTVYEPSTNKCLLRYRADRGFPCPESSPNDELEFVSERNGLRTIVTATPEYLKLFKANHPVSFALELMLALVATGVTLLVALVFEHVWPVQIRRSRLSCSLDSKEELTK